MEKVIHKLINEFTEGVDTYTHNGSTWLIFTESKQWVIELTENKTLWYNYNFFKSVFAYASLDCVQNQHLITKWVEDNIINKVSDIRFRDARDNKHQFEDTLKNGVKETKISPTHTEYGDWLDGDERLGEIIKNGVKETQFNSYENKSWVEGVIKGGVKETKQKDRARLILDIDGRGLILETNLVIRDGVKETNHVDVMKFFDNKMEDALQNGVKETNYDTDNYTDDVKEVIREGVKETSHRQFIKTYDVIDGVIKNGVKSSIPRQYVGENIIDKIIDNRTKNPTD